MLDLEYKKSMIMVLVEKLENSNKRELALQKELADDYASMRMVEKMQDDLEPMPEKCGYISYNEWVEGLTKEISSGVGALAKIEEQKVELEALRFYLENVA